MNKSLSGMFEMDMKNQKEKLSPEAKHITVINTHTHTHSERHLYKQRNGVKV